MSGTSAATVTHVMARILLGTTVQQTAVLTPAMIGGGWTASAEVPTWSLAAGRYTMQVSALGPDGSTVDTTAVGTLDATWQAGRPASHRSGAAVAVIDVAGFVVVAR